MKKTLLQEIFVSKTLEQLKPREKPFTIHASDTLQDALTAMSENKIGSILVTDKGKLVGIFTERDLIKRIACLTLPPKEAPISDYMTPEPRTISARASIARAVFGLASGGYRHLPVVGKDKESFQVISIKDIIHYIYEQITKKIVDADSGEITPITSDTSQVIPGDNQVDTFFFEDLSILNPRQPRIIGEMETLESGMEELCKGSGGCVLVADEDDQLCGIFTERDYLEKVVLQELDFKQVRMAQVMTVKPKTLVKNLSIALGINTLAEGNFRHLPIVDGAENLIGFLSVKDFFSFLGERIIADLSDVK